MFDKVLILFLSVVDLDFLDNELSPTITTKAPVVVV